MKRFPVRGGAVQRPCARMPAAGACAGPGHRQCVAAPAGQRGMANGLLGRGAPRCPDGGRRREPGDRAVPAAFFAGVRQRLLEMKPTDRGGPDGMFFCVVDPKSFHSKSN